MTDADFRRRHREHIDSAWWKTFRKTALVHFGFRCAVCGDDYRRRYGPWMLIVDHRRYRKNGELIFGRETFDDVRTVCPAHNVKGVRSDGYFRRERMFHLAGRFVRWIVRRAWRTARSAWRSCSRRGRRWRRDGTAR